METSEKSPDLDHDILRLRWAVWARIGILSLLSLTTFFTFHDSPQAPTPRILLMTTAALLALNISILMVVRLLRFKRFVGGLPIFGDLVLSAVVVYLTGGAESAFSVMFHLAVIVAGFLYGSRGAWIAALGSASLFTAESLSLHGGVISSPIDLYVVPSLDNRELAYYLGVNIVSLSIVAALTGYLSERERRAGGKLAEAQRMSADLAALNEDIVRSITIGLAATDTNGNVLWLNPAGSSILGQQSSSNGEEFLSKLVDLTKTPPPSGLEGENTVTRKDGSSAVISYRLAPLLDGSGSTHGRILVFQDVTKLREMQEQVERAERLAALGKLSAGLAHEMRNPLGSISGALQLLRDGTSLADDERRLININLTELDRLASLVTQMLDLARPRPLNPRSLDLVSLIEDVIHAIKSSAEAEDLDFNVDVPDSLVTKVDHDQMRQLLWNLLRNATQAAPPESAVTVRGLKAGASIIINVVDEGAGIPPEDRDQVFEPFYSTKRGGIGMGLAICKQVVAGHGGTLSFEPNEPAGSIFTIELPVVVSEELDEQSGDTLEDEGEASNEAQ